MISSDHSTAEISHFLNKWCLSVKTFTTLAHKVFKLKKKLRENEEECKEEWLGCNKSKFSYTKPTVDKVIRYLQISSLLKVLMYKV